MRLRLLLIDSSPAVQRLVEQASTAEGFEVTAFRHAAPALDAVTHLQPDLVVADYHLEDMVFSTFCDRLAAKEMTAETPIIALLSSSDRLDERQMASLGVKAFLKKPLQADDLVDVVRSLRITGARRPLVSGPASGNGAAPLTGADPLDTVADAALHESESRTGPLSLPGHTSGCAGEPVADAMRGIVAQLLQSMMEQTERTVSDRLPDLVAGEVREHLPRMVRAELPAQVESTLPSDQLMTLTQVTVQRMLPDLVRQQVTGLEPMIRETIADIARPLVNQIVEAQLRGLVEAALRQPLGPLDQFVKETVDTAAVRHAREAADTVVRDVTREVVKGVFEQALREMAAGLGETKLQKEMDRLTASR